MGHGMSEFTLRDEGSLVLLTPTTDEALAWAEEYIGEDNGYQPYWPTVLIEPRYLQQILDGIESDGLTAEFDIGLLGQSASTFKWQARDFLGGGIIATGSTVYNVDTIYGFRVETDGTNMTLFVDHTQEFQTAYTPKIDSEQIALRNYASGARSFYFAGGLIAQSNASADRPNHATIETHMFEEDGTESEGGWGNHSNCNPGSTTAVASDVALDGSDRGSLATYWCENAGDTDAETVETTTRTFTSGYTIGGLTWRAIMEASLNNKSVKADARIYDGTNGSNKNVSDLISNIWAGRQRHFLNAPDGASWTQAKANSLKIGAQNAGAGNNTANTEMGALVAEIAACDVGDPAAPTADRRRLLRQSI